MKVLSRDGTPIAFERAGAGPPLILVDGALCSRTFGPMPKLAPLLTQRFTVITYDRRGRGESGATPPYAVEREVEDVAALVREAGEPVHLAGLSSGGALALRAAASGLEVRRVAAYEPPYVYEGVDRPAIDHLPVLEKLVAAGDRGGAVRYFMRDMVGAPSAMVVLMRLMPWVWRKLEAVAHTLPHDAAVMDGFRVQAPRFAAIRVPVLAMHGGKTDPRLARAARAVAEAIPGARLRELAGQSHNASPAVLAPALAEFFSE